MCDCAREDRKSTADHNFAEEIRRLPPSMRSSSKFFKEIISNVEISAFV